MIPEQGAHHGDFAHDVLVRRLVAISKSSTNRSITAWSRAVRTAGKKAAVKLAAFAASTRWVRSLDEIRIVLRRPLLQRTARRDAGLISLGFSTDNGTKSLLRLKTNVSFGSKKPPGKELLTHLSSPARRRIENHETELNLGSILVDRQRSQKNPARLRPHHRLRARPSNFSHPIEPRAPSAATRPRAPVRTRCKTKARPTSPAHVEFTSLAERAAPSRICLAAFTDQHHFMVGATQNAPPASNSR